MFQNCWCTRVVPEICNGVADFRIERGVRIRIHVVLFQKWNVVLHFLAGRFELEVVICPNEGLCAIQEILVDSQSIERQFFHGVTILVDDLHLFYDRWFTAFSRSCVWKSANHPLSSKRMSGYLPKRRILHSLRSRLESSSSLRSICWLRFFCSASPADSELKHDPIAESSVTQTSREETHQPRAGTKCAGEDGRSLRLLRLPSATHGKGPARPGVEMATR